MEISLFEITILAISLFLFLAVIILLKQKNEVEVSFKKERLQSLTEEEHDFQELEKKYLELVERVRELERKKETIYSELRVVDVSAEHIHTLNKLITHIKNKFSDLHIQKRDLQTLLSETDRELELELESYKRLVEEFDKNSKENNKVLEELTNSIHTIVKQTTSATKLIIDDEYILEVETKNYSLNKIIETLLEKYSVFITIKHLNFEKKLFDLLPNTKLDPHKIGEAVDIILNNVIKYADNGSNIKISTGIKDGKINLEISDKSYLFSEIEIKKAFNKIEQQDAFSDSIKGFNLYLVKKIIEEHGGRIILTNDINTGSTFIINLPIIS